jgi:hypothetical protein
VTPSFKHHPDPTTATSQGRLPCDAQLLLSRARTLQLLDSLDPRLRLRQLLATSPAALLSHPPDQLLVTSQRLAALVPQHDATYVLYTVLPHLNREPELVASNFLELDDAFRRAFLGARLPASVFAYLLRAPGASVSALHVSPALRPPAPAEEACYGAQSARAAHAV